MWMEPKLDIRFPNTSLTRIAFAMCLLAHEGQKDRAGQPYYGHPVRVAERMDTEHEAVVALLHDAVEDTDLTLREISSRFSPEVAADVDRLTKREGELTSEYLERVAESQVSVKVKLSDFEDNMRLERFEYPSVADVWAVSRYEERYLRLRGYLRDRKWRANSYSRYRYIQARNDEIITDFELEDAKRRLG